MTTDEMHCVDRTLQFQCIIYVQIYAYKDSLDHDMTRACTTASGSGRRRRKRFIHLEYKLS